MYISSRPACQWRGDFSRKDLPPKKLGLRLLTFDLWTYDGTLETNSPPRSINSVAKRERREASPTRRHHRQPEREKAQKKRGGRALIRTGTMRAKKIKGQEAAHSLSTD